MRQSSSPPRKTVDFQAFARHLTRFLTIETDELASGLTPTPSFFNPIHYSGEVPTTPVAARIYQQCYRCGHRAQYLGGLFPTPAARWTDFDSAFTRGRENCTRRIVQDERAQLSRARRQEAVGPSNIRTGAWRLAAGAPPCLGCRVGVSSPSMTMSMEAAGHTMLRA